MRPRTRQRLSVFVLTVGVAMTSAGLVGIGSSSAASGPVARANEPKGTAPASKVPQAAPNGRHLSQNGARPIASAIPDASCSIGSCFGQGDAAWDAYYSAPGDRNTWAAFCSGGGGAVVVSALDVPACGPTGTTYIETPGGLVTPGFQCVELSERFLYVTHQWSGLAANGAQVAERYAGSYGVPLIQNGIAAIAPRIGDVMSFSSRTDFSDLGHTAVVTGSTINTFGDGQITLLSENIHGTGNLITAAVTRWRVSRVFGFPYSEWVQSGSIQPRVSTSSLLPLQSASFEESNASGWNVTPGANHVIVHARSAYSGTHYLEMNTGTAGVGASLYQDVPVATTPGQSYSFSAWLRSPSGSPLTVCVVLWGLGGSTTEGGGYQQKCTGSLGRSWTLLTASLDTHRSSHSDLRAQIFLDTAGQNYDLDATTL